MTKRILATIGATMLLASSASADSEEARVWAAQFLNEARPHVADAFNRLGCSTDDPDEAFALGERLGKALAKDALMALASSDLEPADYEFAALALAAGMEQMLKGIDLNCGRRI